MAKITVEATRTVEQTKTVEIKVTIAAVKEWLLDNYGSQHGHEWNDPNMLEEYFQDHEELINAAEGNIDDLSDDWEIQLAEEV